MRTLTALSGLSDNLNPVFVREIRQALRSRRFHLTYGFSLISALIVTFTSAALADNGMPEGSRLFEALFICFALFATVLLPLSTYGRVVRGASRSSEALAQITRLTAGRSVVGRLEAALTTLALYLCAFVPFATFAYLLRGLEWWVLVQGIIFIATAGLVAASYAIYVAIAIPRGIVSTLAVLVGLAMGASIAIVGVDAVWTKWPLNLAGLRFLVAVATSFLFVNLAAARISLPSENRETAPRIALAVLAAVMTVNSLVAGNGGMLDPELIWHGTHWNLAAWGFIGAIMLSAADPRIRMPARWTPRRVFPDIVLLPGRAGAMLFFVFVALLMSTPLLFATGTVSAAWHDATAMILGPTLIGAVVPGALGFFRSRFGRPRDVFLATCVVLGLITIMVHYDGSGFSLPLTVTGRSYVLLPPQAVWIVLSSFRYLSTTTVLYASLPVGAVVAFVYGPMVRRAIALTRRRAQKRRESEKKLMKRKGPSRRAKRLRPGH
jgi:hypothetical protein